MSDCPTVSDVKFVTWLKVVTDSSSFGKLSLSNKQSDTLVYFVCPVVLISRAAVSKYHRLAGLKQWEFIISIASGDKYENNVLVGSSET